MSLCVSIDYFSQTPGTLTVVFTPTIPSTASFYQQPRNVLAAWIESSTGTFIKTKLRYVGSVTSDHLQGWASKCGCASITNALGAGCNVTDAITGATRPNFSALTFTWNGTDVAGNLVADGTYNLKIENTWNHATPNQYSSNSNMNYTTTIAFTKGATVFSITPTATNWIKDASINWQPDNTTAINTNVLNDLETNVYPNPTNATLYVDYKNATTIKVVNTLGMVIYDEKIESLTSGTKTIDLSNFANGIYFITVSNEQKSYNQKVILSR